MKDVDGKFKKRNQYFRKPRSEGTCPLADMTAVIRPGTCNAKTKTEADRSGCGASAAGRLVFFSTERVCVFVHACVYFFRGGGTMSAADPPTRRIFEKRRSRVRKSEETRRGLAPILLPPPPIKEFPETLKN